MKQLVPTAVGGDVEGINSDGDEAVEVENNNNDGRSAAEEAADEEVETGSSPGPPSEVLVVGSGAATATPEPDVTKPSKKSSSSAGDKNQPRNKMLIRNNKWFAAAIAFGIIVVLYAIVFPIVWTQTRGNREDAATSSSGSTSNAAEGTTADDDAEEEHKTIPIGTGPFDTTLNLFRPDITRGYESVEELEFDLEQAAWFLLNQVVERNTGANWNGWGGGGGGFYSPGIPRPMPARDFVDSDVVSIDVEEEARLPSAPDTAFSDGSTAGVDKGLNDFGTNNQEDDVEEGDVVVSDGNYGEFCKKSTVFC